MTDLSGEVKRCWSTLENKCPRDQWNALRLGVETNGRPVLAVIDTEGKRHLLIPAQDKRYTENDRGELTVAVGHQSFSFIDGTSEFGRYLDVACLNPRLFEQFDLVVTGVLDRVQSGSDGAEVAVVEVARWRRLFATLASVNKLSLPEKIGLFAELHVLGQLTEKNSGFRPEFWTGPKREPHDFELQNLAIEVKGITSDSYSIQINGFDQLSNLSSKALFLVIAEVELNPDGLTIGEQLEEIALGRVDEHPLRQLAAMAGVFGSPEDTDRFVITKLWIGEVGASFPKLTRENVPFEQIVGVSYSLALPDILPLMTATEPGRLGDFLYD